MTTSKPWKDTDRQVDLGICFQEGQSLLDTLWYSEWLKAVFLNFFRHVRTAFTLAVSSLFMRVSASVTHSVAQIVLCTGAWIGSFLYFCNTVGKSSCWLRGYIWIFLAWCVQSCDSGLDLMCVCIYIYIFKCVVI